MNLGEALRFCQKINENLGPDSNIVKLLDVLRDQVKGDVDISHDRYTQIVYALNTSQNHINELLKRLEFAGITENKNHDAYRYIKDMLKYRGHEHDIYYSLNKFLYSKNESVDNRKKYGLQLADLKPDRGSKYFSLIKKAANVLKDSNDRPNAILASELANITGKNGSTVRGRCEVLLGLIAKDGKIISGSNAKSEDNTGKGDITIEGIPIEVKCAQSISKTVTTSSVSGSAGMLGHPRKNCYRAISDINNDTQIILKKYYSKINVLHLTNEPLNVLQLMTNLPTTFSLKQGDENSYDHCLLAPLKDISIRNKEDLCKLIIRTYKKLFLNWFTQDIDEFCDKTFQKCTKGRDLDAMMIENAVISPEEYNDRFIYELGCGFIKLYQSIENFKGLLVITLKNKWEEGQITEDKAVFLNEDILKMRLTNMAKNVKDMGIQFAWPRLDTNSFGAIMRIMVI